MTRNSPLVALCSAVALAPADGIPEWINLLPAGETIRTVDGRGPYRVTDMQALASASLQSGQKLVLDEVHATDKAAPLGLAAPARGWIVELQVREDGSLWGRVDWNASGRALMEDRAYAGISPAVRVTKTGQILQVLRASLTNSGNLVGLEALHSQENEEMNWKDKLIATLGLDSNADDAAIEAAIEARKAGTALQSQELLAHPTVIALQAQNNELAGQIKAIEEANSRRDAVAFVDGAIAAGRVGAKPARDEYVDLHMKDPALAEKLIGAMPVITGRTGAGDRAPEQGNAELNAVDRLVMETFGVSDEDYKAGLASRGQQKETL